MQDPVTGWGSITFPNLLILNNITYEAVPAVVPSDDSNDPVVSTAGVIAIVVVCVAVVLGVAAAAYFIFCRPKPAPPNVVVANPVHQVY